jgi:hypothetical protein
VHVKGGDEILLVSRAFIICSSRCRLASALSRQETRAASAPSAAAGRGDAGTLITACHR